MPKDIRLAQGITVLSTKTEVTIDWLYPTEGTAHQDVVVTYKNKVNLIQHQLIGYKQMKQQKVKESI